MVPKVLLPMLFRGVFHEIILRDEWKRNSRLILLLSGNKFVLNDPALHKPILRAWMTSNNDFCYYKLSISNSIAPGISSIPKTFP